MNSKKHHLPQPLMTMTMMIGGGWWRRWCPVVLLYVLLAYPVDNATAFLQLSVVVVPLQQKHSRQLLLGLASTTSSSSSSDQYQQSNYNNHQGQQHQQNYLSAIERLQTLADATYKAQHVEYQQIAECLRSMANNNNHNDDVGEAFVPPLLSLSESAEAPESFTTVPALEKESTYLTTTAAATTVKDEATPTTTVTLPATPTSSIIAATTTTTTTLPAVATTTATQDSAATKTTSRQSSSSSSNSLSLFLSQLEPDRGSSTTSTTTAAAAAATFQLEEMEDRDSCTTEITLHPDGTVTVGETDGPLFCQATGTWTVSFSQNDDDADITTTTTTGSGGGGSFEMTLTRQFKAGQKSTDVGVFTFSVERTYRGDVMRVGDRLAISGAIHYLDDLLGDEEVGYFQMIDNREDYDNNNNDNDNPTRSRGMMNRSYRTMS